MDEAGEGDGMGDAARAFEDLRAEVSVMRRAVEALPSAMADSLPPAPPDYRSDVGKVAQMLAAVVGRLDVIEKHPALRLTPEQHRQAIASAGSELMGTAADNLATATLEQNRARGELAGMIGTIRGHASQWSWVFCTGLVACVAGLLLSPLLASVLPFGLNGQVAALVMQDSRWGAGWDLLRAAKPRDANDAAVGYNLVQFNQAALVACLQAAIKEGKNQKCQIIVRAK